MSLVDDNGNGPPEFAHKPPANKAPSEFTRLFSGFGTSTAKPQADVNDSLIETTPQVHSTASETGFAPSALSQQEQSLSQPLNPGEKKEPGLFTKLFKTEALDIAPHNFPASSSTNPISPQRTSEPAFPPPSSQDVQPVNSSSALFNDGLDSGIPFTVTLSPAMASLSVQPDSGEAISAPQPQTTRLFSLEGLGTEPEHFVPGTSEYTRVITQSAARSAEENARPAGKTNAPAPGAEAHSAVNAPVPNVPAMSSPVVSWPMVSLPAPAPFPQVPAPVQVPSPVSTIGGWTLPTPAVQPPSVNPPPVPAPSAPVQPQKSVWETYLPLIFFLNVLFVVAVLLILFFAFKGK